MASMAVVGELERRRPRWPAAPGTGGSGWPRARSGCGAKSSRVRSCSSTRIGKRPCSSGIRSDGLATMEGPGGDEQDVVGLHRSVLGVDRRPLDEGQQVALDALAADVGRRPRIGAAAILSISSMKTMPDSSAGEMASWWPSCPGRSACRSPAADQHAAASPRSSCGSWCGGHDLPNMPDESISICSSARRGCETGAMTPTAGDLDLDLAVLELAARGSFILRELLAAALVGSAATARAAGGVEQAVLGRRSGLGGDLLSLRSRAHERWRPRPGRGPCSRRRGRT